MDLRLFPLNSVLFPGGVLPLHIFEDRYKRMINECVDQDEAFGVVLIRTGREVGGRAEPYRVGTVARITQLQRLPDGRMNLIGVGTRRFRVERYLQSAPYLLASVEMLSESDGDSALAHASARAVSTLYERYFQLALALTDQWQSRVHLPSGPQSLANFVAAHVDVDPHLKQGLLETLSVPSRLDSERELLEGAVQMLQDQVAARRRTKYAGLGALN